MVTMVNAEQAKYLKQVELNAEQTAVLQAAKPAGRFADKKAYRDSNGQVPALKLEEVVGCNVQISDVVALQNDAKQIVAIFTVEDKWLEGAEKSPVYYGGKLMFF